MQPAVRDLARVGVPLPRQRDGGRQRLARTSSAPRRRTSRRAGSRRCSSAGRTRPATTGRRRCARGSTAAAATRGCSTTARTTRSRTRQLEPRPLRRATRRRSARCSTAGSSTSSGSASRASRTARVILRRRSGGPNWVRADELAGDRLRPRAARSCGCSTQPTTSPGSRDERVLLDETFALADAARLEQRRRARGRRLGAGGGRAHPRGGPRLPRDARSGDGGAARGPRRAAAAARGGRRARGAAGGRPRRLSPATHSASSAGCSARVSSCAAPR